MNLCSPAGHKQHGDATLLKSNKHKHGITDMRSRDMRNGWSPPGTCSQTRPRTRFHVAMGQSLWRSHLGVDEHPFATFGVHQGCRVLTHSLPSRLSRCEALQRLFGQLEVIYSDELDAREMA